MKASAHRLSLPLVSAASALLMMVGVSAHSQELKPEGAQAGVYVGGTAGIGVTNGLCSAPCGNNTFAGKIFGGKRLTPGLAAEVGYIMFGETERVNDQARVSAGAIAQEKVRSRAITVGINWEVDLIQDFTNQIRVGWAFTSQKKRLLSGTNVESKDDRRLNSPYVGAGIAFRLTRDIKILSSADFVIHGHESMYLFGVGASAEF
ncbi:MAG: outer membrane beta-barrel protein [Burkholderiales bacterium]|nr:outer membrane beta-barrel protein [Burkholderiales bacterium]MBH2015825.1 outer membrane beta-barrel protein [Burkholderiales bacterium]